MNAGARIPALLLTGGLGAGKTTLLAAWLRQPALRDAALVVNEIGEVALDDRLLRPMLQAAEGTALLANTCVCCAGLPGLEEALADLHRARLERRIPRFDRVVIETTGLAEPQGIREAFARDALLRERYTLEGVVTAVSATTAWDARHELQAQVDGADLLVLTKADRVDAAAVDALAAALQGRNPRAAIARSARASLDAAEMLRLLPQPPAAVPAVAPAPPVPHVPHDHRHHDAAAHAHGAESVFVPLPQPVGRAALARRLQRCIASAGADLLRLKGVVLAEDGLPVIVQWAMGDADASLAPHGGEVPAPGLTVIAAIGRAAPICAMLRAPWTTSNAS